jgi:hypothetical protein
MQVVGIHALHNNWVYLLYTWCEVDPDTGQTGQTMYDNWSISCWMVQTLVKPVRQCMLTEVYCVGWFRCCLFLQEPIRLNLSMFLPISIDTAQTYLGGTLQIYKKTHVLDRRISAEYNYV